MVDLTKSQGLNRNKSGLKVTPPVASAPTFTPTFTPTIKNDFFTTPTSRVSRSSTPKTVSSKFKGPLGFVVKQLPKVIGSIAQVSEDVGHAIGTRDLSYLKNTPAHLGGILSGTRKNSFVDIYRKQLIPLGVNPTVATAMGLYVDIFGDPINAFGGGLTKVGLLASKVSALNKAGRVIAANSKLSKQIAKLGLKAEDLVLAGSKAEQAQVGQRALLILSAFGTEKILIPGSSIYSKAKLTNQVFKAGWPGSIINKVFNTKTSDEGFNTVKTTFDNLYDYRKGKVMEEATGIQKEISQLTQEEALKVVDVVESGIKTGNKLLDSVANRLTSNFEKIKSQEKKLGLLGSEIQDYFPHIQVKGDKSVADRLLDMFRSPRKYSTALGSSKERKILRFAEEGGVSDLIGKPEKLGLKKINTGKMVGKLQSRSIKTIRIIESKAKDLKNRVISRGKKFSDNIIKAAEYKKLALESKNAATIAKSQESIKTLLRDEVASGVKDLKEIISDLREHVNDVGSIYDEGLSHVDDAEMKPIIEGLVNQERERLGLLIKDLETKVLNSQGDEFLSIPITERKTKADKVIEAQKKMVESVNKTERKTNLIEDISKLKSEDILKQAQEKSKAISDVVTRHVNEILNSLEESSRKFNFFDYLGKDAKDKYTKLYKSIKSGGEYLDTKKATVNEINEMFGTNFFQNKPAVAYAERAIGSARAVTSKEFFNSVKPFVSTADDAVEVAVKDLEGMKFAPDVAKGIDEYYKKVKPEEINSFLKMFDTVQNWWKAQALVSPSYHTRNEVGNVWNNFLDGSTKILDYFRSLKMQRGRMVNFIDDTGKHWDTPSIIDEAQKNGVLGEGWYANDIETRIGSGLDGTTWNPLKQNFQIFQWNKQTGTAIENNARLAHFIAKIREGHSVEQAAASVKKYLFDYQDLTFTEKTFFKRAFPFYTWTRKNIPLQLENMIKRPGKSAVVPKTIGAVESRVEPTNEQYLGSYIKDNVGVRYKRDEKGNTFYFLLGNWLPSAQAIDFLSQPFENAVQMLSPFAKVPWETWANKSTFFEDNFGRPQDIERVPLENQTFLGLTMRKKTVNILKNVRLLNELDKLNPGSVWGSDKTESALSKILPSGVGVDIPYVGPIVPAGKQQGRRTPQVGGLDRLTGLFLGKSVPYDPGQSKKFYQLDKQDVISDLKRALINARKEGQKEYAKLLVKRLKEAQKQK